MRRQVWTFLRLVWGEWASRVTGSLSAVVLLLGLGISVASAAGISVPAQSVLQIATWLLVAICGGQAAYAVWARERAARDEAETRLAELSDGLPPATDRASPTTQAFRALREKETRQFLGLDIRADSLRLSFEETDAFQRAEVRGNYVIRTWCVRVENVDHSHLITNCRLRGDFSGSSGHLLNEIGTLQAGERRLVDVATHHEMPADKFIHMHAARPGGFFAEAFDYLKLPVEGSLVTFHVTSDETRSATLICRLFVDGTGKFKMERE